VEKPRASYIGSMIKQITYAVLGVGLMLSPISATSAFAESDAIYTTWRNNTAVDGFDVVTFFSGKPQEGKSEFSTHYMGADWYFSNQANKDLFLTNPQQFAPQYGGYCAWAVAQGKLAAGRAEHWYVEDGKLYLNYNGRIKRRWLKEKAVFIVNADNRWLTILED